MDEILSSFHWKTQIFYTRSNPMTVEREASDEISTSSTSTDSRKAICATNEILRNTFTCIPDVTTKIVQWISTKSTSWDNLTNTTSSRILTKSRIFSIMIATSGHIAFNRSLVNMTLLLHWSWLSFSQSEHLIIDKRSVFSNNESSILLSTNIRSDKLSRR